MILNVCLTVAHAKIKILVGTKRGVYNLHIVHPWSTLPQTGKDDHLIMVVYMYI